MTLPSTYEVILTQKDDDHDFLQLHTTNWWSKSQVLKWPSVIVRIVVLRDFVTLKASLYKLSRSTSFSCLSVNNFSSAVASEATTRNQRSLEIIQVKARDQLQAAYKYDNEE